MKKNKLGVFALGIASLGFLTCLTSGETSSSSLDSLLAKDSTFLVSLRGTEKSLGQEGVKESQKRFEDSLRDVIGNNFTVVDTFDAINTVKIKANKSLQSTISSMPGVLKVALNQKYRFGETYNGDRTKEEIAEGFVPLVNSSNGEENIPDGTEKNQSLETMNVPATKNGGAGTLVAILDSGYYMEHTAFANFDPNSEAAKKANERFNYSDLLKVKDKLIGRPSKTLDEKEATALGYQNKNLNDGSTFYNLKIPYYYDYGGSNLNEGNDFDVLSLVSEHGTHVASITAANGTYKGVAPNAQLALMKVFFEQIPTNDTMPAGVYATEEDIVEALNDCAILGVDTLNMSLGTDLDDFSNKSAAVSILEKLGDDYGVLCNIAAGNSGKALFKSMNAYKDWATDHVDTGILGSYAVSDKVNVLASSTNPTQYYEKGLVFEHDNKKSVVGYDDQVEYSDGSDGIVSEEMQKLLKDAADEKGNVQLITAGVAGEDGNYYGDSTSYSKATQYDKDLFQGKVVVCDRGSNSFLDKATQAEENGAKGLIVINNDPTAIEFTFGMSWSDGGNGNFKVPNIPVVFVLYRDRDLILNKCLSDIKDKNNTTVIAKGGTAKIIAKSEEENPDKYQASDFSSDGSTSDLKLNPTISAPGTSIRGATLGKPNSKGVVEDLNEYSYEYLSGTSMATPNYTGVVALMLGEQNFATTEEKIAYMKSLTMRTMSTATQYESTSYYYDKINVKKEKTTGDYVKDVLVYVPEKTKDGTAGNKNVAPFTPRKQGAGVVNVQKSLNTKVYIEGLKVKNDGSFSDETVKHSKIELKNNDLIKNGKIKVGFNVHSSLEQAAEYDVKLKIMAPEVTSYHSHDNSLPNYVGKDTNLEGAKLQTIYDKVLEDNVSVGSIKLEPGNKTQKFESNVHEINAESKKYLEHFENGTFLEGYVYLVPRAKDEAHGVTKLSAPFMGFYGDYASADATEPFNFEKEVKYNASTAKAGEQIGFAGTNKIDGKLYGSDLVNTLGKNSYLLDSIDTSSMIAADSFENYNNNDRQSSVLVNNNSISNFANEIVTKKDKDGNTTLYVGGDKTDILYIQEYVYRSIASETVEIYDKFGSIVASKNVKDIVGNTDTLFKSLIVTSLIGNKSFIHRGYCELPLYNSKTGVKLPNGNYTIKFTYNLIYGSKQEKIFNLVIDSSKPMFAGKTILTEGDKKTLRLKFNEIYISEVNKVYVNAGLTPFTLTKVSDGYLIDIPLNEDAFQNGKIFVDITDASFNRTCFMINESDYQSGLTIESDALTVGSTYSYTKTSGVLSENTNIDETYSISAKDYTGADVDLGVYTAVISLEKKINSSVQVLGIDSEGNNKALSFTLVDSTTIRVTTDYTTIRILDEGGYNNDFVQEDNATITIKETSNGKVYCDRESGRAGDTGIVYAIADKGYTVDKVVVNGVSIAPDQYGNYLFALSRGENVIEVTFKQA